MENILELAQRLIASWHGSTHMIATVTSNDTSQVYIRRTGQASPDGQSYPKLSGVTVSANDVVLMVDATGNGGWVVLGKILHN